MTSPPPPPPPPPPLELGHWEQRAAAAATQLGAGGDMWANRSPPTPAPPPSPPSAACPRRCVSAETRAIRATQSQSRREQATAASPIQLRSKAQLRAEHNLGWLLQTAAGIWPGLGGTRTRGTAHTFPVDSSARAALFGRRGSPLSRSLSVITVSLRAGWTKGDGGRGTAREQGQSTCCRRLVTEHPVSRRYRSAADT